MANGFGKYAKSVPSRVKSVPSGANVAYAQFDKQCVFDEIKLNVCVYKHVVRTAVWAACSTVRQVTQGPTGVNIAYA